MSNTKDNTVPKQGYLPRQIVRPYYQSGVMYSFPFKQGNSALKQKVEKVVETDARLQAGQLLKPGVKE